MQSEPVKQSKIRIVVLGAGFAGLELTAMLSEVFGDSLNLVIIDKSDAFVFGFSKLDIMFGYKALSAVRHPYRSIAKLGVRFIQSTVQSIDPYVRRVKTDKGIFDADILIVALGADIDITATPSLANGGNEFYTVAGAGKLREVLPGFKKGSVIIGVTSTPFKCPPAPSEAALLLDDFFTDRGVRNTVDISVVMPFGIPIPPAPKASQAILAAFAKRNIRFIPDQTVQNFDPVRKEVVLRDGTTMKCDLFLGVPKHRVPSVVQNSGLALDGWIPVNPKTLETRFESVYAVGDVTSVGTPKAGVFAEGAARTVALEIIAKFHSGKPPGPYTGAGACYMEFGNNKVGRIDVDFLSGLSPTGTFQGPSRKLSEEKSHFGSERINRWFMK